MSHAIKHKEKKFKFDKWYKVRSKFKYKGNKALFFIEKKDTNEIYSYGFDHKGKWFCQEPIREDLFLKLKPTIKKVNGKGITIALINEALKRGYYRNNTIIKDKDLGAVNLSEYTFYGKGFDFIEETNTLCFNGAIIFKNGVWSKIIKNKYKTNTIKKLTK